MTRRGFVAGSLACAAALRGDTGAQRGRRVIDECIQALGGAQFRNLKSTYLAGRAYSFYREQLTGLSIARISTHYLDAAPGSKGLGVAEREFFGKKDDYSILFLPNEAWEITFRGARPLPDDRFKRYRETTLHDIFYILRVRLKEPGWTFESRGSDVLDNRPVEIVDLADAANNVTTVYFDQTLKWPVRQVFRRLDPDTRERDEEITDLTKYRDIGGGVQWPLTVLRTRNGEKIYELFADSGEANKNFGENIFSLPSGMKTLKPI